MNLYRVTAQCKAEPEFTVSRITTLWAETRRGAMSKYFDWLTDRGHVVERMTAELVQEG